MFVYASSRDTDVTILSSSFVTNYADQGNGGALLVRRDGNPAPALQVVIEDSILNNNEARDGNGGGLYSNAQMTIRDSAISGNRAREINSAPAKAGGLGSPLMMIPSSSPTPASWAIMQKQTPVESSFRFLRVTERLSQCRIAR